MTALTVSVSGDTPAEVATRLRALADALAPLPSATPSATTSNGGGLPAVPPTPTPRVCSVHHVALTLDSWTSKAGKACKAWRCPEATAATSCDITWVS